ncbi:MAG: EAL domain-containing protein [Ruminococcaceae bacterium]|nr:EAL domain-containing protein [Oscillospiraceae bacterium]
MFGTDSLKWKEVFGVAWKKIAEVCPEIGGFIIFHETGEVVMDENAKALANIDKSPEYNRMLSFLSKLPMRLEGGAKLMTQILEYNDQYTAGILKRQVSFSELKKSSILPLCDVSRLIIEITKNKTSSLLALIKLEMSGVNLLSEYQMFEALTEIIRTTPDNTLLSAHSPNCFWLYIPDFCSDPVKYLSEIQKAVKAHSLAKNEGNDMTARRYIGFSAGICAHEASTVQKMSTAEFALFEAELKGAESIVSYSDEKYESGKGEYEKMSRFMRLINDNLFMYHFQPIVSARDGEIIAYEMLMRSDSSINMNPLEILDCAEKARRLYDIEKATMKNALSIIGKNQDMLKDRKLFVNSITAHMLTDNDWNLLEGEYGELMEKMVIEFTEQTEIDDQSINTIRARMERRNIKLAIDDYGTGYSNTSNLIRYNPDYVKIDRMLIDGINSKPKVRKLVAGIVEFIHENGYQALAEGVETYDELKTVIQLGCDLIQGYYVSKPKPVMLLNTAENICKEITDINLENFGSIVMTYTPEEGEEVDLCRIATDGYSSVMIDKENVTLRGSADVSLEITVLVKNGTKTALTLDNAYLKTSKEPPIIDIGDNCEVCLTVNGKNILEGRGIYVPRTSDLHIAGGGDLKIISNMNDCYAIGTNINNNPGNIFIELIGKLFVEANGDTAIGIGGGKNESSNVIVITSGEISVVCSGKYCLGIGITDGNSIVDIENCCCNIKITAPDIVGIGSFKNKTDMQMKNFRLTEELSGINIAGVGTISEGTGKIIISDGTVENVLKGRTVNGIGTRNGNINCRVLNSSLSLYCECASVSGVGDMYGSGDVFLEETCLDFEFQTGDGFAYGSRTGQLKCIKIDEKININA